MRSLQLPGRRRARIWLGESPNADFWPSSTLRRVVSSGPSARTDTRIVAIELAVRIGHRTEYGLLGAELRDDDREYGEVSVAVSRTGTPMPGALAVAAEDVRVGLRYEHAACVITGVERVVHDGWRFRGELTFRWAAYSADASPSLFGDLAACIARVLASPAPPTDAELITLLS